MLEPMQTDNHKTVIFPSLSGRSVALSTAHTSSLIVHDPRRGSSERPARKDRSFIRTYGFIRSHVRRRAVRVRSAMTICDYCCTLHDAQCRTS